MKKSKFKIAMPKKMKSQKGPSGKIHLKTSKPPKAVKAKAPKGGLFGKAKGKKGSNADDRKMTAKLEKGLNDNMKTGMYSGKAKKTTSSKGTTPTIDDTTPM